MKPNALVLCFTIVVTVLVGGQTFSQSNNPRANETINPLTGTPLRTGSRGGSSATSGIDPLTGLPLAGGSGPADTRIRKEPRHDRPSPESGNSLLFVSPSNHCYGLVIELSLNMNENGLSDCLNLDYGTVVSTRELQFGTAYMFTHLQANGIAIFPPRNISPVALTPLTLISKRTRLLQRPEPNSQEWDNESPPPWLRLPAPQISDGFNQLYDQAKAFLGLPAAFGFQTSLGNAGMLQIVAFTEHPSGVKIRYKLLQNPDAPKAPNLAASPEDWSPTLAPGEKPDLMNIRFAIKKLMDQDRYEEALERQVWYFNHALQYGEPDPIRLTFGISHWGELCQRYPKAKRTLINMRDRAVREFSAGGKSAALFAEIHKLNQLLQDDRSTVALFKSIDEQDNSLARKCYNHAEDVLAGNGEYALCLKYLGDPQARFESICALRQTLLHSQDGASEEFQKFQQAFNAGVNRQFGLEGPSRLESTAERSRKSAQEVFVQQTRQLTEILVATGRLADAQRIRDQSLAVVDDPRLKSAITDAERNLAK